MKKILENLSSPMTRLPLPNTGLNARQGRIMRTSPRISSPGRLPPSCVLRMANDLRLLTEEIWATDKRPVGNVLQALSHLALINSAIAIDSKGRPPRMECR